MQVSDKDGTEADNKDEAIVPTDMNLICDDDLRLVLEPLKKGVKFTMVWLSTCAVFIGQKPAYREYSRL